MTRRGTRFTRRFGFVLALTFALISFLLPTRAHADEVQQARAKMGQIWYDKYCTPCHGEGGAPGTAVYAATKKPVDLRDYVARHGGKFPSGEWLAVVAGPRPGAVHTEVWEKIDADQSDSSGSDAMARGVAATIAEYVASIQKK